MEYVLSFAILDDSNSWFYATMHDMNDKHVLILMKIGFM